MALRGALVDRARRVVREPLPEKIEGTTQFVDVHHAWFRCRVTLDAAPDTDATPQPGYRRTPWNAQFLCATRDVDRNCLELRAADRLEICSRALGEHIYELTSEPQPIRKKRRIIGYQFTGMRVLEHPFEEAEP